MDEIDALKLNVADIRKRVVANVSAAEASEKADAAKQGEKVRPDGTKEAPVARDPFKSVANNFRRALMHIDELDADLTRAQRDLAMSKLEN